MAATLLPNEEFGGGGIPIFEIWCSMTICSNKFFEIEVYLETAPTCCMVSEMASVVAGLLQPSISMVAEVKS